ncbi:MAG: hypothetical protein U0U66_02750 [Cytophagaceae bacterium]
MIRYKDVSIPEPCTFLNTSKESKVDNAYFCSQCDKKVYDFRNKKESYLNEIHAQTNGKFCGVYYEDQIRTHIPTLPSPNFFQRIKQYSILYLTTAFSFVQQHSWASEEKITSPTFQVDQDSTQKFYVTTKEGKKYEDTFRVNIYINNKYYQSKYITDSTTIWLPDTINVGDKILIKTSKFRRRFDWGRGMVYFKKRTHVIKHSFKYKGEEWVEISAKEKKHLVIHLRHRRSYAGVMLCNW